MKEVVKAEVIKLLDVGVSYPISNSTWVSSVYVVPKKGGMTVVANEKNELIPTRTVTGWRRCMLAIFDELVEDIMEVFMDDFSDKKGAENLAADHLSRYCELPSC
ncbi:uncharacterized protein [Gossypium hirsutum]|uniref:Uncharacterized protein n=1 Tax=Gossypium hirsutum TaxID=3635 RepID=A0A1U8L774_GOSHI|nr:uncharacterized protein LOC107923569 [Gossypium hirsutum]